MCHCCLTEVDTVLNQTYPYLVLRLEVRTGPLQSLLVVPVIYYGDGAHRLSR